MVSVPPQAHIVWNEDRSEGVIFVDHEPGSTAWPLTAADDAHQASTGRSRCPGIGSALAEAFFEAYEDDEDRPVQTIPLASLTAAPVREEGGAFKLGESDLFEVADIIRTARGVKHVGSKDYAVADEIVCFVNNHPRNSAAALATREEAPAEVGEVSEAIAFLDAAAVMLGRGEMPAPATDYAAKWYHAHAVALSALRAQPQAREEAQPVAKQWRACNDQGPLTAWREADWRSEREVKAWEALHRIEYRDLFTTPPAPEAEKLRVALHLFRAFVQRNVGQWAMGAGDHGHPIWAFVAEALGDANGAEVRDGPEYRFIQPENRQALAALQQDALSSAPGEEK